MRRSTNALDGVLARYERVERDGLVIWLPPPAAVPPLGLVRREELLEKALAAWLDLDAEGPMHFRLYGPPGTGKNALVYLVARELEQDLYILNGHQELGPEDIACTPVMTAGQTIEYVASPLLAAMLRGGICFFDEIGKVPSQALSPLASVLDERRTLSSVVARDDFAAKPAFRFCAALNQNEEEAGVLPKFIEERTVPAIEVALPAPREMRRILEGHLKTDANVWVESFMGLCSTPLSPRSAIKVLGYARRLHRMRGRKATPTGATAERYLKVALAKLVASNDSNEVS